LLPCFTTKAEPVPVSSTDQGGGGELKLVEEAILQILRLFEPQHSATEGVLVTRATADFLLLGFAVDGEPRARLPLIFFVQSVHRKPQDSRLLRGFHPTRGPESPPEGAT
jgi:hypothetical protein